VDEMLDLMQAEPRNPCDRCLRRNVRQKYGGLSRSDRYPPTGGDDKVKTTKSLSVWSDSPSAAASSKEMMILAGEVAGRYGQVHNMPFRVS